MTTRPTAYSPVPGPPVNPSLEVPAMTMVRTPLEIIEELIESVEKEREGVQQQIRVLQGDVNSLWARQDELLIQRHTLKQESQP